MGGVEQSLELDWGQAAEGVLASAALVGALDPSDDREAELSTGGPAKWRTKPVSNRDYDDAHLFGGGLARDLSAADYGVVVMDDEDPYSRLLDQTAHDMSGP